MEVGSVRVPSDPAATFPWISTLVESEPHIRVCKHSLKRYRILVNQSIYTRLQNLFEPDGNDNVASLHFLMHNDIAMQSSPHPKTYAALRIDGGYSVALAISEQIGRIFNTVILAIGSTVMFGKSAPGLRATPWVDEYRHADGNRCAIRHSDAEAHFTPHCSEGFHASGDVNR